MNYQNLYAVIPKYPKAWSINDVSDWLRFVHLQQLIQPFKEAAVDGSCINLIDNEILEQQLGVKSGIVRKKLINWIQLGLQEYQKFLNKNSMMDEQPQIAFPLVKSETSCIRNSLILPSNNDYFQNSQMEEEHQQQMIIESFEGNNLGTYIVKPFQILSVGYNKNNDIHSLQSTFHDKHALIGHNGSHYYVKDLGSKHGTFLKVTHRTELFAGTILEIGSFQFEVGKINIKNVELSLKCLMGDLGEENKQNLHEDPQRQMVFKKNNQIRISLKQANKFTFGRRKQNNFQKNDKHMSGIHCKIIFFNKKFYVEDFGSTNGTWIRISREGQFSSEYPLANGSIIKIGTTVTYLCRKKQNSVCSAVELVCRNCQTSENNCLFYPCSHNILCYPCSENFTECPQCNHSIFQKIKIHK